MKREEDCPVRDTCFAEDGVQWYALHVRGRFEKFVARNLGAKGYEQYVPLYRKVSHWSDRRKEIELPLFPGYVFCKFDPLSRLPVLTIPGVNGVVGYGNRLVAVRESELDAIRSLLKSNARFEPCSYLNAGQWVRIEYGPLAGLQGFITRFNNGHRLVLSVDTLRRSVAVEVDICWVKAAS